MIKSMLKSALPQGRINEYSWGFIYDDKAKKFNFDSFEDRDGEGVITKNEIEQVGERVLQEKAKLDQQHKESGCSCCICCAMSDM